MGITGMAIAFVLTANLHQCCVTTDEAVRWQWCAERAARIEQERQCEQEWYQEPYYDYGYDYYDYDTSDGISAAEFQWMGVVEDGEHFYTWYSERVLPGGGLTELNENGRHTEGGYVMDGDGYIAVASSDYEKGTVLETPFGAAKVYDTGCDSGTVDVYVSF